MSTDYREQITEAVDAIRILSWTSYTWFGRRSQSLPFSSRVRLNEQSAAACLAAALQHQLYSDFYTLGRAMPVSDSVGGSSPAAVADFTRQLSRANCGTGYWDDDWTVTAFQASDIAAVTKNGLSLQAEFSSLQPRPTAVGQSVAVSLPHDGIGISPGYFVTGGGKALSEEPGSLCRLYWNVAAADAPWLMRSLTLALNEKGVAYRFKTLRDPTAYTRADAAVLYFCRSDWAVVRDVIGVLYPSLPHELKAQVPALTLPLAPGLGFAEDPGGAQSFGLHRCRFISEGLVRARERGAKSLRERVEIVESRLLQDGILLERPYVNSQSAAPDFVPERVALKKTRRPARAERIGHEMLMTSACEIGRTLCRDALWHRNACTWVGVVPDPNAENDALAATECRSLGPDLYAGTSGIGLFLAQLHALAPSKEVRTTALGATRHALSQANATEPYLRLGLYTGLCGIALAALRVAHLLADEEIEQSARQATRRLLVALARRCPSEPDLLSGKAGAILSLLVVAREFAPEEALATATRLGDKLLRIAHGNTAIASWPSGRIRRRRNLTGLSHGAAGIGLALLEVSVAVQENRYAVVAERAFEYERRNFDVDAKNWRDFRQHGAAMRVFASAWCNGAPGIGLSRLRTWQLSGSEPRREEAEVALLTTSRYVASALNSREAPSCLCHGLTGNADILLESERIFGRVSPDRNLIEEAAARAVAPTTVPGLMLGKAGVGYFLLRVAHPTTVPTALLPTPAWLTS